MFEKNLTITNQVARLEDIANALDVISSEWNIPQNVILNLNLVIEELVTNIIFYGYDDKKEHEIQVHLSYRNKIIKLIIEDDGREFNPLLAAEPDMDMTIENSKIGGLGIHFVRKIMDDIHYQRSNNKNILTLTKHII